MKENKTKKKGLFSRLAEKMDKKLEKKAKEKSCCCCCGDDTDKKC